MYGFAAVLGLKTERRSEWAFECEVEVSTREGTQLARALIDSGAQRSFVYQRWAKQHYEDSATPPRLVIAMDGHDVQSYGAHDLDLEMRDSAGVVRNHELTCEAVDMSGFDMIIGMDWLTDVNPDICWRTRTWRYRTSHREAERITAAACMTDIFSGANALAVYPRFLAGERAIPFFAAVTGGGALPM
jgi:hypothetical protein